VVQLAEPLRCEGTKIGDHVLLDQRSGYVLERLPKSHVEEVVLEEVPNTTYDAIGGLGPQIEALRDAIELPYRYPGAFREHQRRLQANTKRTRISPIPRAQMVRAEPGCRDQRRSHPFHHASQLVTS
jgi:Proteasomal ATPase OB C-terminal domain